MKKEDIFNKIGKISEKYGKGLYVVLGLLGVLLIIGGNGKTDGQTKVVQAETNAEEYRCNIENNLSDILTQIDGVGKVKVMVTIESGEETVYARQEKTTDDTQAVFNNSQNQKSRKSTYQNEFVMVARGGEKNALVEKVLQPSVQGVVVVCRGADDINVVSNVTNAVSVALNLPTNRICVIKMQ